MPNHSIIGKFYLASVHKLVDFIKHVFNATQCWESRIFDKEHVYTCFLQQKSHELPIVE